MGAEPAAAGLAHRLTRILGVLLVLTFVGLLAYGLVARSPDTTIDDSLASRQAVRAPGFGLPVLAAGRPGPLAGAWSRASGDGRVELAELRGTPVVLNYWASWCNPCRTEAPVLQSGWRKARRRGVLFVGLNMQDVREDARAFLLEFGLDFPHVRDPTNATARSWGVTGIPETFFISREGRVVGHVIGTVTSEQLADGVAAAIAGQPRAADQGGERRPAR